MESAKEIRRDIQIEDLLDQVPQAIAYLMRKGIHAIACGAPIWGSLEEAARGKGYTDAEIDAMAAELTALLPQHTVG
jgi:hypothetical protein